MNYEHPSFLRLLGRRNRVGCRILHGKIGQSAERLGDDHGIGPSRALPGALYLRHRRNVLT